MTISPEFALLSTKTPVSSLENSINTDVSACDSQPVEPALRCSRFLPVGSNIELRLCGQIPFNKDFPCVPFHFLLISTRIGIWACTNSGFEFIEGSNPTKQTILNEPSRPWVRGPYHTLTTGDLSFIML